MTVHDDLRTRPDTPPASGRTHEHAWLTESAHRTSLGRVRYVICPACGTRRVDLEPHPDRPPVALSVPVTTSEVADQSRAGGALLSGSARG